MKRKIFLNCLNCSCTTLHKQRSSTRQSMYSGEGEQDADQEESKPHKYIIQAQLLRNSWPLSEANWAFVQMLKEMEKNELKGIVAIVVQKSKQLFPLSIFWYICHMIRF